MFYNRQKQKNEQNRISTNSVHVQTADGFIFEEKKCCE